MGARSLNKVTLIGNLTRDPELRYTPSGTAVCTFGLATNRSWTTHTGETKEETEFHRIVAWNKLGELCVQLLAKGRKAYVEGRLSTHAWTAQDGTQRTTTEIVIEDMIILDSRRPLREGESVVLPVSEPAVSEPASLKSQTIKAEEPQKVDQVAEDKTGPTQSSIKKVSSSLKKKKEEEEVVKNQTTSEDITPDDIPF